MASNSHPAQPSVARRLTKLALPVVGLNILSVLSIAVDTAMCGHLENKEDALNALAFATQIVFFAMVLMMGLVVGTVAFVARAHGAGDESRVNHILHQSSQLTLVVSLAIAVFGNLLAPMFLRLLGASEDVLPLALSYLRPSLALTVFPYLTLLYAAVLRGVGNTRLPFLVGLVSNALNVLFNYGLILGHFGLPALGVGGAALGTIVSQACGVIILVVLLRRGAVPGIHLSLRPAPIDRILAKDLARVGAPAGVDMLVFNVSFASIVGMLGHIDPLAVAAHGVGIRLQSLAFVPGLGVSQATGAMVGNALGANDPERARSVAKAAMALCTGVMTAIALVLYMGAEPLIAIFQVAPGTHLFDLSLDWVHLLGYGSPIIGVHIAIMGVLRGAGATRSSLMINVIGTLFQVPMSWFLGYTMGLGAWGIWAAFPLSFILKSAVGILFYLRGDWAKSGSPV